jgi:hypothetical protein
MLAPLANKCLIATYVIVTYFLYLNTVTNHAFIVLLASMQCLSCSVGYRFQLEPAIIRFELLKYI